MSLLDSAKYQIKTITNTIKTAINATVTSSTVSYGFIGISTAILGYYTFFENDIETPQLETLQDPISSVVPSSVPPPSYVEPPTQNNTSIIGGKKKKNHFA